MWINHALAYLVGSILFSINGRESRTTLRNLALCFPEKPSLERRSLARKSLIESAKWIFEAGGIWFRNANWRHAQIVQFSNLELFEEAVADDRGVLLIMPHFGNWELAGLWVGDRTKITCIYRTPKMEDLDQLVRTARKASELSTIVPATARGVKAILKALKRGELTIVLPDQVPVGEGGIYAPFFGIPVYTQTLVHNLVRKTSPIVLQVYARRQGRKFELGFMQLGEQIYSKDARSSAAAMNQAIESLCLMDTSQYQWEYKRFKHQEDGTDYYAADR